MAKPVDSVISASADEQLIGRLAECVGAENIQTESNARILASQDVYRSGEQPLAVVQPATTAEVSQVVALAAAAGVAVYPRGGGLSYTDAYLPNHTRSIVLDTSRLREIREVNVQDRYALVEAGCTWAALDAALEPLGVRATFWGPMSGRVSTIGGAMSLGSVTFGSARNGPSTRTALGLEVVTADGSVIVTGSAGQLNHSAFHREYGPDLTGLFCADCGALGIKTAIAVRLEARPTDGAGLSFSFNSFDALVAAIYRVSQKGLATEVFGAETALVSFVAGPPDIRSDFRQLLTILRGAPSYMAALRSGLRAALNGRRFLKGSKYLINFLTEGDSASEVRRLCGRIRQEVGDDGVEVGNTAAEFTRAMPFPEPAVVGPGGRRLLPLHGIVPYSRASDLHQAFTAFSDDMKADCDANNVMMFLVYTTSGRNGFLYEVVIYWQDDWLPFHRVSMSDEMLSTVTENDANPSGRALVETLRLRIIDLMYEHGCTHYQIGRAYPYTRERHPATLSLLKKIKADLDPDGLINPGVLGL